MGPVVFYWSRKFHFGSIKMKIKNRVLHVKERPLRGENPSAEGGGGLAQFAPTFFSVSYSFKLCRRLTAICFQLKKISALKFNPRFCQPQ
mgnify:CR=1 FL=1